MSRKVLKPQRSDCPIASTLDFVGDKWTLLVIRDVGLFGKHRNKAIQEGDESIPSNILANRLKQLVEQGIIEKRLYQERPPRYEYHLTKSGRELLPIIKSMATWGAAHVDGAKIPEALRKGRRGR